MSDKKRKASSAEGERPAKKPTAPPVNVNFVAGPDITKPVIATAPGISLPSDLEFQSFSKKAVDGKSELLLNSSSHPTIDFSAKEGDSHADRYLKHYVAVYDPATKNLQVTEAKKLTVKSCVRQRVPEVDSDEEDAQPKPSSQYSGRAALTHAFGTKKSKRAVQSMAENRLLARFGDDTSNPLSSAILATMPTPEPAEEPIVSLRSNKPLPIPNLTTKNINEVYPLSSLVSPNSPASTLKQMPVDEWCETISNKEHIKSTSRFIANRSEYLVKALIQSEGSAAILQKVQLLRYTLLLIELYTFLRRIHRSKRIPPVKAWPTSQISGEMPPELLIKIVKRYSPDGTGLAKNDIILLQSTILALALHIPPPSMNAGKGTLITEPTDLQLDLSMAPDEVRKLYRELGCKMDYGTPDELERWGLKEKKVKKEDGKPAPPKTKFAKLTVPPDFPKQSSGKAMKKRR